MNGKRYSLVMALAILAAAIGGASFNRLLFAESTQAQRNNTGQQWEYCSLTQAAYVGSNRGGVFWISYFRDSGVQVVEIADSALEKNGPAKAITKLGAEGWEMVGQGPLEIRQGVLNAIYFKRPKVVTDQSP